MKYFLFLISFTKIRNLIFVLLSLSITTVLEYLFVFLVPFLFKIIFQEQNEFINYFNDYGFFEKSDIFKVILIIIISLFLVKNLFYFANQYVFLKYSFSIHNKLTRILFSRYLSSNYQIFINSESSLLIRNLINNTGDVRNLILNSTTFFSEVLVFIGLCVIIIYQSTIWITILFLNRLLIKYYHNKIFYF
jgi:hypothetical protein